ncbi:MAG: DUF937 domain-containing protein [Ramlibacter sp.]|nr:DUF937 domain-containing protein [Ramlibacter sp.]
MANDFLTQILSSVLGGGAGGASSGGLGGGLGGLGGMLGSVLGGANRDEEQSGGSALGGKGGMLVAMLLPLAMQWVQRNGGIGGVLDKFREQGHGQQVASWVSTGENEAIGAQAVEDVVGADELSRMSQQLGVSTEDVASGFANILPQVVNHLTPAGDVPDDADNTLGSALQQLSQLTGRLA